MKQTKKKIGALAEALLMKKGDLLSLLNLSRPHAHMIETGQRSMPSDAGTVVANFHVALATSEKVAHQRSPLSTTQRKDIQRRISELNYKIQQSTRSLKGLTAEEAQRMKALHALELWVPEATQTPSRREIGEVWKKFHMRRLQAMTTTMELAAAQARLAGLNAELEHWKLQLT
jgi:hypothetical protein